MNDKELLKLVKHQHEWGKRADIFSNTSDKAWKEQDKSEKKIEKELKKRAKLPKGVSVKIEGYRIYLPIKWGWLKIRKIK